MQVSVVTKRRFPKPENRWFKWGAIALTALASLGLTLPSTAQLAPPSTSEDESSGTRLLRYPDINGDTVVFAYAGDLWRVDSKGGAAVRLTAHPGLELFPKVSPDGRWVAFTGQYDGDEQVYVIPVTGGVPKQLTHYPARGPLPPRWGYDNQVYGWTPDSEAVLFRSLRDGYSLTDSRLYTVSYKGGLPKALPMPVSGGGNLSPDEKKAVYSPLFRDFRTWKRYEGGWAQNLYVFDIEAKTAKPVTTDKRTERDPMWVGERIYFNSDRTGTFNLFELDPDSGELNQLTSFDDWDVRWPSADQAGQIVFERAGRLHVFDANTKGVRTLDIQVGDDGLSRRPERIKVGNQITDFALSPKAKRALFVARGDLFSAPVEKGITRNLTATSDAHEREASWSHDGREIAYISDATGEEQLYAMDRRGEGEARQLTQDLKTRLYGPRWSLDDKFIALMDKTGRLHVVNVETAERTEIDRSLGGVISDYHWSPKGHFLAYSKPDESGFKSLYIWSMEDAKVRRITGPHFNESEPVWDPKGDYLFYLSDRTFAPQIGAIEWNYVASRQTGIFALALRKDVKHLFPIQNDLVEVNGKDEDKDAEDEGDADEAKPDEDEDEKPEPTARDLLNAVVEGLETQDAETEKAVPTKQGAEDPKTNEDADQAKTPEKEPKKPEFTIDFDGLAERSMRVPVDADNLVALSAVQGKLIYARVAPFFYGRPAPFRPSVYMYDLKKRKGKRIATDLRGYAISGDGRSVLVQQGGSTFNLYPAAGGTAKRVSTRDMAMTRDPRAEWSVIFDEVWRRFRDYFYVENMHGYDWAALRDQYRELLPHVAHRSDLNYLIGEMIAELNVSHAYKSGGDFFRPVRPNTGLLGARFELDPEANRYQFSKVMDGHNEEPIYRSPLTEVGMNVEPGDYLMAINGEPVTGDMNVYALLRGAGGQAIELSVADAPDAEPRTITLRTLRSETNLIYLNWVEGRRAIVDRETDGKVGYLHIPDMGGDGIREFIKWYYPQIRREGLIVDVRGNGGGNVSQMLINRLRRVLLGTDFVRDQEYVLTYPSAVFTGPMVAILDENSASDGDIFPWTFREAGLGPLIGKRSWGGVIGITSHGPLLDGASVFVPEFGNANADGEWVMEGTGVEPDIEVENSPEALIKGEDPQLIRAIAEVQERMKKQKASLPKRPADPVKTK
ncbi:MAG: S41 family peptidase [Pseudomonadota bacterium]